MQPAGMRANFFSHCRSEGNHVVLHLSLNVLNALQIEIAAFGNCLRGLLRYDSGLCQGQAGGGFYLQPAAVFIFVTPDAAHLWARITGDHILSVPKREHR